MFSLVKPLVPHQTSTYLHILVPRGHVPFGQHPELQPLGKSNFPSMHRAFFFVFSANQIVKLDSEHVQSNGMSMDHGLPVLDLPRGRDSWCWPPGDEKGISSVHTTTL